MTTDHLGYPYPSREGAMAQALEKINLADSEPWYYFSTEDVTDEGEFVFSATSFDGDGHEDHIYLFRINFEKEL